MDAARYRIEHDTDYHYGSPVSLSQQLLHVSPRDLPWQRCLAHDLSVEPAPTQQHNRLDAFGNAITQFAFDLPHDHLRVRADSEVEVLPRPPVDLNASPEWESVCALFDYHGSGSVAPAVLEAAQFLYESPHVPLGPDFADYAARCFPPELPMLGGVAALAERIHSEFTFDPHATSVATPVATVLHERRGVCQDFAHLMLACLRSLGLPARYVSGYLLTQPPPGQARLVGADASHAWVAVYCPHHGWVEFDPTNNLMPGTQHVTVAWGRDFSDVSPMRGVILGGSQHALEVRVTMTPLAESPAEA